jgi:hypothetical protein
MLKVVLSLGVLTAAARRRQPPMQLPQAQQQSYYVSSSVGSDAASGTDPARPWQSLARVASATVRAGDQVLLAAGDVWSEPLVIGCTGKGMRGDFEQLSINATGNTATITGWVVDSRLPGGGSAPVAVQVLVNGTVAASAVANVSRPDLVPAGVAPDPHHGFVVELGAAMAAAMQHGLTRVAVMATSTATGCGPLSWPVTWYDGGHQCGCDGAPCTCPPAPASPAVRVGAFSLNSPATTTSSGARPVLRLDGAGDGITVTAFDSVEVAGIEVRYAARGVVLVGPPSAVTVGSAAAVTDCVFRGVWNRSSIGQTTAHAGRDCTNGWSGTVQAGGFDKLSVANCLFDDVDVAVQASSRGDAALKRRVNGGPNRVAECVARTPLSGWLACVTFPPRSSCFPTHVRHVCAASRSHAARATVHSQSLSCSPARARVLVRARPWWRRLRFFVVVAPRVALQPSGQLGGVDFAGNTMQHANGNTVMLVGDHTVWRVHDNVFSRDDAPRFFMCGTTDIMIGGVGVAGSSIYRNEIGLRGEHTGSPDGFVDDA